MVSRIKSVIDHTMCGFECDDCMHKQGDDSLAVCNSCRHLCPVLCPQSCLPFNVSSCDEALDLWLIFKETAGDWLCCQGAAVVL